MNDLDLAKMACDVYHIKSGEKSGTEYFIENNKIAFRGTGRNKGRWGWAAFVRDLVTDSRFLPWRNKEIGWHPAGFVKKAAILADHLEQRARDMKCPIVLTGHSKGAAVILLMGAIWAKRGIPIDCIITFGCPRVGLLPTLDKVTVRMHKNGPDAVTMFPPGVHHPRSQMETGSTWKFPPKFHSINKYIKALQKKEGA